MGAKNPKTVTVYGRLSFPTLTAQEAYDLSQKGQYPAKDVASAAPHLQLLLEDGQLTKLNNHIEQEFFPYCVEQEKKGEKKDVLTAAEVKKLQTDMAGKPEDAVYNTPFKQINEKTAELAPEAVACIKVIGPKGGDFEVKAIVNNEDELAVPDPDLLSFPVVKPINSTVHSLYPGCYAAITLNLYAYHNDPKRPGLGAGGSIVVFKADGDRFGGGAGIDMDDIFED